MSQIASASGGGRTVWNVLAVAIVCALLVWSAVPVSAQESGTENIPQNEMQQADGFFAAPVVIDGETLFLVRGSSALPARDRALNIRNRIVALAELPEDETISFSTQVNEFGRAVMANGQMVTVATQADADFERIPIEGLAELQMNVIKRAVAQYRESRSGQGRIDSALVAFGWTVAFVVFSLVFLRRWRKLVSRFERFTEARFTQFEEATKTVLRGKAVAKLVGYAVQVALWVAYFFVFYYYLSFVLLSFAETRPLAQILLTYVTDPLIGIFKGFASYIPNFITLIIIAVVTRYTIKGLQVFMENVEAGTFEIRNFEPHWVRPTFNIVRVIVIAIALVFAYPYIPGSDSRAFQGLTLLAGLMLSLGSNTVVSNMMAGLFVIYRRSTTIGDRIKVGEQVGDVVEIKLMETLIKSVKNEMISIPNAQLLNSEVVNYSRKIDGRGLLVHTTVGIGYEEQQDKIEAMLIEAALRTDGLNNVPKPFVLWTGLADYAINYQINAYTSRGSILPKLLSDLHRNIVDVFNENAVQIMTPSYMADPEQAKIATEPWDGTLAHPRDQTANRPPNKD
jgi:small-conductance mechanosensitive channel